MREEHAIAISWGKCPACGYHNEQEEVRCEKCGRRLPPSHPLSQTGVSSAPSNLAIDPSATPASAGSSTNASGLEVHSTKPAGSRRTAGPQYEKLRKDLSTSVRAFRSRRLNGSLPLQFEEENQTSGKVIPFETAFPAPIQAPPPSVPQRRPRRVAPQQQQEALDFPSVSEHGDNFLALPVAPFQLRMIGHGIDFALTLAVFLVFLLPLKFFAGPIVLNRLLLLGGVCAYLLLALSYGFLFLYLTGATPAMRWVGLRIVNFDGMPPARRQLLFRFLGAIASVGSFSLGFLWAAIDEEHLTWHDRISKTFLTLTRQGKSNRG